MPTLDILIPQMGEGLTEVVIVGFDKKPGDSVQRDEQIYSMETDKATIEVESPYTGVIQEWLAKEGDILPIGAPIARIAVEQADGEKPSPPGPLSHAVEDTRTAQPFGAGEGEKVPVLAAVAPAAEPEAKSLIPPRSRAYAKQKGVPDDELRRIPAPSGKLSIEDIDAYLAAKGEGKAVAAPSSAYAERAVTPMHRTFIHRLRRSAQIVIPAVLKRPVEWGGVQKSAAAWKARGGELQPSEFQVFAYGVAQAAKEHPRFRSSLPTEETIREYAHVNLGIAVGKADGQLNTAVVREADTLDFETFVRTAQTNIRAAREGLDQADESVQLLLTYMGAYEIFDAIPVLVAPAVGVLFIGATFTQEGQPFVNLSLTFDHRLIQGVEAALFLSAIVEKTHQIETLVL